MIRTMGSARACCAAAVVCLVLLLSPHERGHAAQVEDDPMGASIEAIKQHFGFADWAGKTGIPGDVIPKLAFAQEALKAFGAVSISTPAAERDKELRFRIEPRDEASGAGVSIELYGRPLDAHEAAMRYFTTVSAPRKLFEKAKTGTPAGVGDVCIVYKPTWDVPGVHTQPFYASIMFARDNALVRIEHEGVEDGKHSLDLLEIGRAIDLQLVMMGRYGRLTLAGDEIEELKVERTTRWLAWPGKEAAGVPEGHFGLEQTFRAGDLDGWLVISVFDDKTTAEQAAQAWRKDVAAVFTEGLWPGADAEGLGDRCWYNVFGNSVGLMVQAGDVFCLISVHGAKGDAAREAALALAKAIAKRAAQPEKPDDSQDARADDPSSS